SSRGTGCKAGIQQLVNAAAGDQGQCSPSQDVLYCVPSFHVTPLRYKSAQGTAFEALLLGSLPDQNVTRGLTVAWPGQEPVKRQSAKRKLQMPGTVRRIEPGPRVTIRILGEL